MRTAEDRGRVKPTIMRRRPAGAVKLLGLLLLGGMLLSVAPVDTGMDIGPQVWAQTADPSESWPSGKVTALGKKSIQINGKDYPLDSHVIVKYDTGGAASLPAIAHGDTVRFHLKQGRIDMLVIVQPG